MDVQALILLQCSTFDASERHVQGELVTSPHCGTVGASSRGRPSRRRPPTQVRLKFVVSGTSLMVPKPAPRRRCGSGKCEKSENSHSARNRPRRLHRETGHFFMVSMASKRGEARLRRSVRALLDLTSSEARTGGAFAQPSPTDPNPEPILPTPAMALPLFPPAARPCFAATQHLQSEIDHDTTPWVSLRTPVPVPMQSVT